PVPATGGYINIGDAMVFVSALLFGPIVGGFAGGVGSALADLLGGYLVFAPITLVVKGLEGFVAGLIRDGISPVRDALAVLVGGIIMIVGYLISEAIILGLGFAAASVEVPGNILQILVGGLASLPTTLIVRKYVQIHHQ
ncbi:MAG: ECF transporter S component, partial [Candidatus Bathyarchaeia archaeon]